MLRYVAFVSILLAVACVAADSDSRKESVAVSFDDLNLQPVSSAGEEPVECTLRRRFSQENALKALDRMRLALGSFRELTTLAQPVVPTEKLAEVGNLAWDTQNLGFANWLGAVTGTLQKQRYMIAKLQYDLARERLADNEISAEQAEKARLEYEEAKKDFLKFWNSFCIAD